MANIAYITNFLTKVEGPRQRRGYVPSNRISDGKGKNYIGPVGTASDGVQFPATGLPTAFKAMGASGVTIATGCDLGQTDVATLKGYGLSEIHIVPLRPYIGLKTSTALKKLYQAPLLVSAECAEAIDHAVHGGYLKRYVEPTYNKASKIKFADLPAQAQAVIFSIIFQKGATGVPRDWPKTWKYLTSQDWKMAAYELKNGFRQYAGRRQIEGKLLEELCK